MNSLGAGKEPESGFVPDYVTYDEVNQISQGPPSDIAQKLAEQVADLYKQNKLLQSQEDAKISAILLKDFEENFKQIEAQLSIGQGMGEVEKNKAINLLKTKFSESKQHFYKGVARLSQDQEIDSQFLETIGKMTYEQILKQTGISIEKFDQCMKASYANSIEEHIYEPKPEKTDEEKWQEKKEQIKNQDTSTYVENTPEPKREEGIIEKIGGIFKNMFSKKTNEIELQDIGDNLIVDENNNSADTPDYKISGPNKISNEKSELSK